MTMVEFTKYRRTQIAEMIPYSPDLDLDLTIVSVSKPDREAGSPKAGDMVARNPKNHSDMWLVAAKYFADNFELHESEQFAKVQRQQ
jgi:hypothetical protein